MENKSLKSGFCPVCEGNNVFTNKGRTKQGERTIIPVTSFRQIFTDIYMCISCGYIQEFTEDKYLKEEKTMTKLKEKWKRVL